MRPTQIARLDAGLEGFTVEAVVGVVFERRDGKFGPTQDIRIKDDAATAREDEITLRLRDREIVPREARDRQIRVVPGEYKGKKTGVKWNVRTAADGRVFKEVVVSRSARIAIEGLGEVKALPKTEIPAAPVPASVVTTTAPAVHADEGAAFDAFATGKSAPRPAPAPAVAPAAPAAVEPATPARSTGYGGNGHGPNGKGQYTAEDLVSLAGYFAPKVLGLGLPEGAVGQVLDGLLRVATVTGTRPPVVQTEVTTPAATAPAPPPNGGTTAAPAPMAASGNVIPIRQATAKQVALLRTLAREAGKDDSALLAVIERATERHYDRLEDLSVQDASRLIEAVRKALREKAIRHYASAPAERKTA